MGVLQNIFSHGVFTTPAHNVVQESTLTAIVSPVTIDVNGSLGHKGNRGYVACDSGTLSLQVSQNGTVYGTAFTINTGEKFDLSGCEVSSLKLTRIASDAAYRVNVY